MEQKTSYNIKTVNLETIHNSEVLHRELSRVLAFPVSYNNNWESFWIMITEVIGMPDNLIIYNRWDFSKRDEENADALGSIKHRYNELKGRDVILDDRLEGLNLAHSYDSIEQIFERRPSQFGLRGDDHLWSELERYFSQRGVPEDEQDLVQQIHEGVEIITGNSFKKGKRFFVEKFNSGGMSSGWVDDVFWLQKGIPLLIGRYKVLRESQKN